LCFEDDYPRFGAADLEKCDVKVLENDPRADPQEYKMSDREVPTTDTRSIVVSRRWLIEFERVTSPKLPLEMN
jgi:hypothetical protein